jgi:hypothetical protein
MTSFGLIFLFTMWGAEVVVLNFSKLIFMESEDYRFKQKLPSKNISNYKANGKIHSQVWQSKIVPTYQMT